MKIPASCSAECIKQLVANVGASGLWAGVPLVVAGTAGAAAPLAVAAACVLTYLGLSLRAQRREVLDQNKAKAALDLIRRRTAKTPKEIEALSDDLRGLGIDLARNHDEAIAELRSIRERLEELDRLAPLAGKPAEEVLALVRRDKGLLVSIGRFCEDNFTRLEKLGIRVEATLEELKASFAALLAALLAELGVVREVVERTGEKVDWLGGQLAELLALVRRAQVSVEEARAQIRAEVEREYADKFAQERSAREAAERAVAAVMEVRAVPGIEQALREKGGQAIVEALLAQVAGPQEAVIAAHRKIAEWAYLIGNIEQAERSLAIILAVEPNDLDAINRSGHIHQLKGRLDDAECCYRRRLELAPADEGVAATSYGNLGLVLRTRGDLEGAEAMFRKSLEIEERLGRPEGMASAYGNLGLVLRTRGDLDGAEAMFRKSLEINERLGRPEGMAKQYGNLGGVCRARGDTAGAREWWTRALELFRRIGMTREGGLVQKWLDDLDRG